MKVSRTKNGRVDMIAGRVKDTIAAANVQRRTRLRKATARQAPNSLP
jgi:hypothetical protein